MVLCASRVNNEQVYFFLLDKGVSVVELPVLLTILRIFVLLTLFNGIAIILNKYFLHLKFHVRCFPKNKNKIKIKRAILDVVQLLSKILCLTRC